MRILDTVANVSFLAALVALPFLIVKWFSFLARRRASHSSQRDRTHMPILTVLAFAIPILVSMAASDISQHIAHNRILEQLQEVGTNYRISIDGRAPQNPNEILATLKKLDWLPAHHSSPTERIPVQISDGESITLELARDSSNPREYWVFYPKYSITEKNEIGRIITPLFDAY